MSFGYRFDFNTFLPTHCVGTETMSTEQSLFRPALMFLRFQDSACIAWGITFDNRRGGVAVKASALQPVGGGSIPLSSYAKNLKE